MIAETRSYLFRRRSRFRRRVCLSSLLSPSKTLNYFFRTKYVYTSYFLYLRPSFDFLKSFMIETPSMSRGVLTPAMSKNDGAMSMFAIISFILETYVE